MGCVGSPADVHRGKRRTVAPPGRRLTVGRGVLLPLSVPLPSLGRQQSGRHWRCAVHGGRGPPYHSGSCSPSFFGYDLCGVPVRRRGPACSSRPPCGPAAGAGGRVTLRLPSRVGGAHPPCLGGGVAPRPPRSRSGRRPAVPLSGSLRVAGALPSGARVRSGLKCRPGVGGVRGGPWTAPLGVPADLHTPPLSPRSGLWLREGHAGRGLRRVPLCALLRHAGVGSREACGWGRPPGPGGAEGRACGSPAGVGAGGGGGGGGRHPARSRACVGGGGSGGGPSVPWRCLLSAKGGGGGAAWRSRPRGPAIGQGGRALPPPPSTESRILPQSLSGAPHPPAIAARRWPAGGGRGGQRSVVSGLRGSRFPPALAVSALPPAGGGAPLSLGRRQGGRHLVSCCPSGAWPPIPFRFAPTRLLWARSARRPGAQALAHLFFAAPTCAGGWGVGAGHTPAPLSGGGGPSLLPRGVGAGAPVAGGPVGGRGGGVSRRGLPALVPGGGLWYSFLALSVSPVRSLPGARVRSGLKCRPGVGGVRGGPWTAPLGAPSDLKPSLCHLGAGCGYGRVMWGAASFLLRCVRCSGTPVWVRGSRPSRRCPYRAAVLPEGGAPPRPWGGGGPRLWLPCCGGCGGGGGGGGAASPPALGSVRGGGGGGGLGGAPWPPGDASRRPGGRGGGGMAVLVPVASHRPGGRALHPPPLSRAGCSRRPSPGPLPPRPLSRGAGRPGVAVGVSGQWLAGSLSPHSLPREVARSRTSCHTVGGAWVRGPIPPPQPSRTRRLGLHLRRRLCGGWGCGGGGLCRR